MSALHKLSFDMDDYPRSPKRERFLSRGYLVGNAQSHPREL